MTASLGPSIGAGARWSARIHIVGVVKAALLVLLAGNLVRLPALSSGAREAPVSVNDLAVLTVIGLSLLAALQARRLVLDGVARRALLFAAIGGASAVLAVPRFGLSPTELLFSLAYLARWLLYFGLYVAAINALRRADVEPVRAALEGVVFVFAAFGIVQSIFLPGFAQLVYPESTVYVDWDPQGHRLVSTILDPNYAGAFVVIGFLLALARLSSGDRRAGARVILLAVALVLTASRSSMLAAFVGALVVAAAAGLSRRALRVGVALACGAALAAPALFDFASAYGKLGIDASALQRVVSWLRALQIVGDHPVIGIGFNTYGFVQRAYGGTDAGRAAFSYSLDGGLLFVAVMTGFVGLAVYVAMLGRVGAAARRVWRRADAARPERALAIGTVAATVAIVVHSVFVNSLLLPFIMEPLWLLWAMTTVLDRSAGAPAGPR